MIKGKSLTLQLVTEKHLDKLYSFHSDISNRGEFFPLQITPEHIFKAMHKESGFWNDNLSQLLIVDQSEAVLGSIWAMKSIGYFDALEIGYIIYDTHNRSKGYMTESLALFVDYLFKVKKLNRLEIRILPTHLACEKVALKCGFEFEGVVREAIFHHGKFCDLRQFSLLRKNHEALTKNSVKSL